MKLKGICKYDTHSNEKMFYHIHSYDSLKNVEILAHVSDHRFSL